MSEHTHDHIERPIAIHIWQELQKLLEREKSPYLAKDKFVLQKDAFTRLADEDLESDAPWLSYIHQEVTSDEALDFSLYFFAEGFVLHVGPTTFEVPYYGFAFSATENIWLTEDDIYAADPGVSAKNILITIKLLLNGQFAIGCNWRKGQLIAAETFLLGYEIKPFPIAISGDFSLLKREADSYTVKQNDLISEHISITDKYPLLPPVINDNRIRRGRDVDSIHDLKPLNKKAFEKIKEQYELHEFIGKQANEGLWNHLYRTTEFWLVTIGVISIICWLKYSPHTPAIFHSDWMHPVYLVVSWTAITFISGFLLGLRQNAINAGQEPLVSKFEHILATVFSMRLILILISLALIPLALFMPIWTPKGDYEHIYSASMLLDQFPILYLPPAMSVLIALLLSARRFYAWRPGRFIIASLAAAYVAAIFIINGIYMNSADNSPEPSGVAVMSAILLPIAYAIICIITAWRPVRPPHVEPA